MKPQLPLLLFSLLPLGMSIALPSRSQEQLNKTPVLWEPIGTVALVINEYWSVFTEYSAGHATLSVSVNLDQNFPLRIT